MRTFVIGADCREAVAALPANLIDAVVTDPPYALVSIGKRFGAEDAAPAKGGVYARAAAGFMGKKWDTGEVAFDQAFWASVLRVLKPGGHLLAFGGTRTYHRLATAIEDAGFDIRDQIGWTYGSGFPKSHNQDGEWEGWGSALKPAWEPIVMARKPLDGTIAGNLEKWGVGALNIDGCRIEANDGQNRGRPPRTPNAILGGGKGTNLTASEHNDLGRWPANLIHDGSDEVVSAFPNDAARFFYCAKASRTDRDDGLDGFEKKPLLWPAGEKNPGSSQSANTDKSAKNNHPTVKPTELMRYLCRLVTPPGGLVLDPFMGSGSTGRGAVLEGFNFIGVERDPDYVRIARARIAAVTPKPEDIFT